MRFVVPEYADVIGFVSDILNDGMYLFIMYKTYREKNKFLYLCGECF